MTRTLTTLTLALLLSGCASAYRVATPFGSYIVRVGGAVASQEARGEAQPTEAPSLAARGDGGVREAWATDLLRRLGNDQPSPATAAMIVEWTLAEDAGDGTFLRHNPLNTTQPGYGEIGTINDDGVRSYATYADGMAATLQTLSYPAYREIVAALLANDPDAARRAVWASPWAESHYGYGAGWPRKDKES